MKWIMGLFSICSFDIFCGEWFDNQRKCLCWELCGVYTFVCSLSAGFLWYLCFIFAVWWSFLRGSKFSLECVFSMVSCLAKFCSFFFLRSTGSVLAMLGVSFSGGSCLPYRLVLFSWSKWTYLSVLLFLSFSGVVSSYGAVRGANGPLAL